MNTREIDKYANTIISGNLTATPFSVEESAKIRCAVKLSRQYRTDFYHAAIMAYANSIIAKSQASLSPQDMPEREALSCEGGI